MKFLNIFEKRTKLKPTPEKNFVSEKIHTSWEASYKQ